MFADNLRMPAELKKHMLFVKRSAKRLARNMFFNMLMYQQKLESKQNILGRFVDIGADLFVMSGVCSYAVSQNKPKDNGPDGSPIDLADLFCRQAKVRIQRNFQDVYSNQDTITGKIAKKVLDGSYEWLENEIIKTPDK